MTIGQRSIDVVQDILGRIHRQNLHLAHSDHSPRRRSTSLPSLLACLFVCRKVKGDEEKEVGAQDAHASKGSKLFTGAPAVTREVGKVRRREVCVGGEVDEA